MPNFLKKSLIKKFIYASTSSVYGIKKEKDIDENKKTFIDNNLDDLKKVAGIKNINYSGIEGDEDLQKINNIELKIILIK